MDSARSCSYFSGSKPLSLLEDWMDAGNIKKARQAAWTATDVATFVPDLRATRWHTSSATCCCRLVQMGNT
jgi:hypothetical protein